eukprot:c10831_g2_i1.p1 GENE.c10831_g2_i1~~c10831_g2_i1.p1  ORF type:complete len:189 (+),score=45.20 c10831_g2_i1:188-754(+)
MTINGRLNRVDYALRLYVEPDSGRAINKLTLPLCVSYGYPPDESKPHQHTKASKQPHHTELPMDPNMGLAALVQGSWSNANKNQNQNQNRAKVSYHVIGESQIAVPTHFFKAVLVTDAFGNPSSVGAFVVPNNPISSQKPLESFVVDVRTVEKASGLLLFDDVDKSNLRSLCVTTACVLKPQIFYKPK